MSNRTKDRIALGLFVILVACIAADLQRAQATIVLFSGCGGDLMGKIFG